MSSGTGSKSVKPVSQKGRAANKLLKKGGIDLTMLREHASAAFQTGAAGAEMDDWEELSENKQISESFENLLNLEAMSAQEEDWFYDGYQVLPLWLQRWRRFGLRIFWNLH
eukprot:4010329-Pyramimonas_sp.AAC.1